MTKAMQHCTAQYKIELIYVQTSLKGQGNHELALLINRKKNDNLPFLQIANSDAYNCFHERTLS